MTIEQIQELISEIETQLSALEPDAPERQDLEAQLADAQAQLAQAQAAAYRAELEARIEALGDIALLVQAYYDAAPAEQRRPDDAFNLAGFTADHIESDFGWHFEALPKPSLAELEQIKEQLES
jgi:peptidoglycan hydrolase CwlO-like protein